MAVTLLSVVGLPAQRLKDHISITITTMSRGGTNTSCVYRELRSFAQAVKQNSRDSDRIAKH